MYLIKKIWMFCLITVWLDLRNPTFVPRRLAVCRTGLSAAGSCGHEVALCAREVAVQEISQSQRQD